MSLQGLDDDAVVRAYQVALAETGGWFLLQYVNRDTVSVLDAGSKGVGEARAAVGRYEEKSPLFGLVQFRRKKIILKYVPEGTSRLLQVRLAVQFQSILDTFTPHDTVFSFTSADELSDSTLGLSTMKLQDGGSMTSSTSSLRQRRLNEITETAEESIASTFVPTPPDTHPQEIPVIHHPEQTIPMTANISRPVTLLGERQSVHLRAESGTVISAELDDHIVESFPRPRTHLLYDGPVSPLTNFGEEKSDYLPLRPSDVSRMTPNDTTTRPSSDFSIPEVASDSDDDLRRPTPKDFPPVSYSTHLSRAESHNISRWTDDVVASTKQKRASRPHIETNVRPKTSGTNESASPSGPIANLPVSVRVTTRVLSQSSRPGSQQSTRSVPGRFVPSATIYSPLSNTLPTFPEAPSNKEQARPQPPPQAVSTTSNGSTATAEKMRLMKALQMRKRNQILAQQTAPTASSSAVPSASIESFHSTISESRTTRSASLTSSPTKAAPPQPKDDLVSINESETTSPTSILTASDCQSTKPSSLSTSSLRKRSQTSLSSDTNSSTTPKAESDGKRLLVTSDQPNIMSEQKNSTSTVPVVEIVQSSIDSSSTHAVGILSEPAITKFELKTAPPHEASVVASETISRGHMPDLIIKKKQPFGGNIQIPLSSEVSDASDDESFLDELQHATVLEAKPVSVNRTPVTPVMAKTPTKETHGPFMSTMTPKSVSNESQASTPDRRRTTSRAGSVRSISATLPQWPPPPVEPVPTLPKQKPVLGSNISKRIKALEGLSQRDNNSNSTPNKDSSRLGAPPLLKRSSFRTQQPGASATPEPPLPRAVTMPLRMEPEKSEEKPNLRPLVQRPGTSTEVYTPAHKGETVSVTARIVRDPVKPKSAHGTSDTSKGMHRSPLIVEYDTSHSPEPRSILAGGLTTMSTDSVTSIPNTERRRFSFSSHKSSARPVSSADSKPHSFSISSPRKRSSKSASETSSVADEKRASRASRMLRRLSGLGKIRMPKESPSSPAREVSSPPPNTIEEQAEVDPNSVRHVVDVGEVNVQFPETMLWKRRFLRVDDQGYLIFASFSNDQSTEGRSRRIHLEEVLKPCLPDLEHEEMAWSIQLGLKDGRRVQCACESRGAQKVTLKLLTDAHWAYHQLYHQ